MDVGRADPGAAILSRLLTRPAGASVLSFGEGHRMRWRAFAAAVARWCFRAIVSLNNEGLRASALLFASLTSPRVPAGALRLRIAQFACVGYVPKRSL